jgi:hypothetical protein
MISINLFKSTYAQQINIWHMEFFKLFIISHMNFPMDGNYIGQLSKNMWHKLISQLTNAMCFN